MAYTVTFKCSSF